MPILTETLTTYVCDRCSNSVTMDKAHTSIGWGVLRTQIVAAVNYDKQLCPTCTQAFRHWWISSQNDPGATI